VLALDHSRAATGIALGSFEIGAAQRLLVLRERDESARLDALARVIADWVPVLLVLGLPLDRAGGEQAQTRRVRRFAEQLHARFALPVALHDERWSTVVAEAALRAAGRTTREVDRQGDAEAAREILQGFFDACKARNAVSPTEP
jgi:putative Holliday junction resolvase